MDRRHFVLAAAAGALTARTVAAGTDHGKPGAAVKLVVGYQPYYTQAWSAVVMRGKRFYEKYLPKGSAVEFQIGLQGTVIVNALLAGTQHIGYMGDMPSILCTTRPDGADVRLVANLGLAFTRAAAFLHSIKAIGVEAVRPEAIESKWTEAILKERGLRAPIGQVRALPDSQAPKS